MTTTKIIQLAIGILVVLAAALGIYAVARMNYTGPGTLPTADMDEFAKTDPALVKYRELDPIKTGLPKVRGIAVGPDDRIYVCGENSIRILGPNGKDVKTIEAGPGLRALAVADDGAIYAATTEHVQVVTPDGKVASWPGAGDKAIFTSVAVAGEHVYVADAGNLVVREYDKAGKVTATIGRPDLEKGVEGFVAPSPHLDVAVGRYGLIRVSNPGRLRVETFTSQGELLASWGEPGNGISQFAGCCNPTDIALLHDGRVVTSEKGLPRVKVYATTGEFQCVVAGTELFPEGRCSTGNCTKGEALDLAADSRGRILVLDPATHEVRVFVRKEEPAQ